METFNERMVRQHMPFYISTFKGKFNRKPSCWWNFTVWLGHRTMANSFNQKEINLIKRLMEI